MLRKDLNQGVSLAAEQLWLVKDGGVSTYIDDLATYRSDILKTEQGERTETSSRNKNSKDIQQRTLAYKADVKKCEERLNKLQEMKNKVTSILADQSLYSSGNIKELEKWNKKFSEINQAIERAEDLWLKAHERMESASLK